MVQAEVKLVYSLKLPNILNSITYTPSCFLLSEEQANCGPVVLCLSGEELIWDQFLLVRHWDLLYVSSHKQDSIYH